MRLHFKRFYYLNNINLCNLYYTHTKFIISGFSLKLPVVSLVPYQIKMLSILFLLIFTDKNTRLFFPSFVFVFPILPCNIFLLHELVAITHFTNTLNNLTNQKNIYHLNTYVYIYSMQNGFLHYNN